MTSRLIDTGLVDLPSSSTQGQVSFGSIQVYIAYTNEYPISSLHESTQSQNCISVLSCNVGRHPIPIDTHIHAGINPTSVEMRPSTSQVPVIKRHGSHHTANMAVTVLAPIILRVPTRGPVPQDRVLVPILPPAHTLGGGSLIKIHPILSEEKIFQISSPLFSIFSLAAILDYRSGHRTQF